jgi:hypothetical protein
MAAVMLGTSLHGRAGNGEVDGGKPRLRRTTLAKFAQALSEFRDGL